MAVDRAPRLRDRRSDRPLSGPPFRSQILGRLSQLQTDDKLMMVTVAEKSGWGLGWSQSPLPPVVGISFHLILLGSAETVEMRGAEMQNVVDIPGLLVEAARRTRSLHRDAEH